MPEPERNIMFRSDLTPNPQRNKKKTGKPSPVSKEFAYSETQKDLILKQIQQRLEMTPKQKPSAEQLQGITDYVLSNFDPALSKKDQPMNGPISKPDKEI